MQTVLDLKLARKYKSASQKIRVLSESWVNKVIFCPSCGCKLSRFPNNQPVADFYCTKCIEQYELKSKRDCIGSKIVDGAYKTMIARLMSSTNPNFFLLNYSQDSLSINNFFVIPKHFFVPQIIEERKALSPSARRAGWVGCNIVLKQIPQKGKIFYLRDGKIQPKNKVLEEWQKTLFLREQKEVKTRGWIIDVMNCIDSLQKKEFTLDEVYSYEKVLQQKHPNNRHVKDKIRQQLQLLRDKGYLEFIEKGRYRLR